MSKKESRIDEIIKSMTLEEKVAQMQQLADHILQGEPACKGIIGSYLFTKSENKEKYIKKRH